MKSHLLSAGKVKLKTEDIVVQSLLGAFLILVQVAFAVLPNIELVSTLIIIYTVVYGKKAFCAVYVFVLVEGLIYGFGLWWLNYTYVWSVLVIIVLCIRKINSALIFAMVSGFFGLVFGGLCAIPYLFIGGVEMAISYWVGGILFDITHCISNFVITLILFVPLYKLFCNLSKMKMTNNKYM